MTNREYALQYVRGLLDSGYTTERAENEALFGLGDDPGFEIQQGVIRVPWHHSDGGESFKFRELANEASEGQQLALI